MNPSLAKLAGRCLNLRQRQRDKQEKREKKIDCNFVWKWVDVEEKEIIRDKQRKKRAWFGCVSEKKEGGGGNRGGPRSVVVALAVPTTGVGGEREKVKKEKETPKQKQKQEKSGVWL